MHIYKHVEKMQLLLALHLIITYTVIAYRLEQQVVGLHIIGGGGGRMLVIEHADVKRGEPLHGQNKVK